MIINNIHIKIIAALLTGCFFLCSCENDENEIKNFSTKIIGKEEGKEVTVKYSINGKQKAVLTAPLMYRVQDTIPYVEFPNRIHVNFYDAQDSIESKLDARYAKYKESQNRIFLRDSVTVINVKGDTLYCDELYWDRNRSGAEFYTDKPVRIRTRTHTINGIGMEAKQDFKEWHIIESTGFIKVPSGEFPN